MTVFENGELVGEGTVALALLAAVAWVVTVLWREPQSLAGDPEQFYAVSRKRNRIVRRVILAIAALWLAIAAVDAWVTLH